MNVCLSNFDYLLKYINVCTDTEHQGNRYPAAKNSASPPETYTQQLNTPGTVPILQGVLYTFTSQSTDIRIMSTYIR